MSKKQSLTIPAIFLKTTHRDCDKSQWLSCLLFLGILPLNGRGRSPIFSFYIRCTWTHLHCYATWCFLHWNTSSLLFLALEHISVLRNMMWGAFSQWSLKRKAFRWFLNQTHFLFKIRTKKQNFGRFWQTHLHLETLLTMVAISNGNVSSPKES